ncbi:hypothetical protein [Erwinia mallotivora]|uniref:hypothetical protein n=1 Tax=Erwinia mallotivora TaxID=69222 RepID=UPI0021BEC144|nr:hypothetical protein [Erwinia mallotivora]
MVKKIFSMLCVFFPLNMAFAIHNIPRTVVEIKINETGESDDESINVIEGCRAFKITKEDVKEYFSKSYPVPLNFNIHERYSPCYAKGFIEFSDNTRGKWKISSSGGATLVWDTGDAATLFYNDYKWTDPFEGTYTSDN